MSDKYNCRMDVADTDHLIIQKKDPKYQVILCKECSNSIIIKELLEGNKK